ncbi:MAG: outer membrane protein OmpA-like peptidoglycan-associated protein [Polaribacter sp.]|jgi:outer membrane protein OmpA-like peptidoglycan-associated protein
MRSIFFGFLFFLMWASFARYYYVCKIKNHCGEKITAVVESRPQTLNLTFGEEVILEGYEQFAFAKGESLPDLNARNNSFLDALADILKEQPERSVTITGSMLTGESASPLKNTLQENLGLARAEKVRNLLIARGIDEKRISLDYNTIEGDRLIEPISFSLFPTAVDEERPDEYSKVQFSFHDMTYSDANFAKNSDVFTPGSAFLLYADSVVTYMNKHSDKGLTIIGHTDSDGNDFYNDELGKKRANSARQFFIKEGMKSKINTASLGEKQPVAPNDGPENMQKNRRVNFKID